VDGSYSLDAAQIDDLNGLSFISSKHTYTFRSAIGLFASVLQVR